MQRRIVNVAGLPTEVYTIPARPGQNTDLQVLIVPGNPGLAGYYTVFMKDLHGALGGTAIIHVITHLGNCSAVNTTQMYSLKQQTQHKVAFVQSYMLASHKAPVAIVGHSIGAYMGLHCARQLEDGFGHGTAAWQAHPRLHKVVGLFPFLAADPRSRKQRLLRAAVCAPWAPSCLAAAAGALPRRLQRAAVRAALPGLAPHAIEATLGLLSRRVAQNALYLARHEFADLAAPADWSLLRRLGTRAAVVCAPKDMWFPRWKWEAMWTHVPSIEAYMEEEQKHDFCVSEQLSAALAMKVAGILTGTLCRL